jgi:hypothetical protein
VLDLLPETIFPSILSFLLLKLRHLLQIFFETRAELDGEIHLFDKQMVVSMSIGGELEMMKLGPNSN